MAQIFSRDIENAGKSQHQRGVSLCVSAHDRQYGSTSVMLRIETANFSSLVHLDPAVARKVGMALAVAVHQCAQAELAATEAQQVAK